MIKHPSPTKTQVICDKCRIVVEFAAGLTDEKANDEIGRHGWKSETIGTVTRHICTLCSQGKWGTH